MLIIIKNLLKSILNFILIINGSNGFTECYIALTPIVMTTKVIIKQTTSNSFSFYDERLIIIDEVHQFRNNARKILLIIIYFYF